MRLIGRALRALFVVALLGGITSAIAAAFARRQLTGRGEPEDNDLDVVGIYSGMEFKSFAPAFRSATVTAWYGGSTLDLRAATLDPAGATLTVRAIFGGIRLVVPESWPVVVEARGVFGGLGDVRDRSRVDESLPTLTIQGFAVFGGVGIVSEAPDLDGQEWLEAPSETSVEEPAGAPA
jgi:predicted membrane protein